VATDAQIAQFRAANLKLTRQVEADLDAFWGYLDLARPDRVRTALLNYVPLLVQRYGDIAAGIAADWFEELRWDAAEQGLIGQLATSTARSFTAAPARPDIADATSEVRYAAGGLYGTTPETVLTSVKNTATRQVLQTGRRTITRNTLRPGSRAVGWARRARPGSCRFCRALAARGAVYKEATARFASHAPKCNCVAYPSFDPDAPEVDVAAYRASRNTARMKPAARERHRQQVADWLDREFPGESDHPTGEHTTDGETA
jgi:hypothetical protein